MQALLVFHVLIAGKKHVEAFSLDQLEQCAVFDTTPLHTGNGVNVMLQ